MKKRLTFIILLGFAIAMHSQNIVGSWNGTLNIQGATLRVVFNIMNSESGYTGTMDSPDQGVKGIPLTSVTFNDPALKITIDNARISYEGQLVEGVVLGSFKQSGSSFSLNLNKGEAEKLNRPQEPVKPYPYASEDVIFDNKSANITLAGTLTYPKEGENFPVVILISGSGAQNRNEELMGHKPFLLLSDYLTRRGIAVLRYDDRGTAQSEGDFMTATAKDLATDALAAFDYLKTRKEINTKKVGLLGHSEGGTIAFILASENKEVAYIVSLAGSLIKGDEQIRIQRKLISEAAGLPAAVIEQNEAIVVRMQETVDTYSIDTIKKDMNTFVRKILLTDTPDKQLAQTVAMQLEGLASPGMQYFLKYDPSEAITKVKCPILALNGEKDLQVDATANLSQLEKLVKSKHITIKKYPNLNHLFQNCKTGQIQEYTQIEETMSPEVLEDIATWILKTAK